MENNKIDIQFEYILREITFYCEKCKEIIVIKADESGWIKERNTLEYNCKCGNVYKIPSHYVDVCHNKQTKIIYKSTPLQKNKVKTYIATFWRGNVQHENGGYETTREVRASTKELAEKRAEKEYGNPIYGTMSLIKVEEKGE